MWKRTNKLPMIKYLVASNSALQTGSLMSGSNVNLSNGQLGVISADIFSSKAPGTFLTSADTPNQVGIIKVVQGTPKSGSTLTADDLWRVSDPSLVESSLIIKDRITDFTVERYRPEIYGGALLTSFPAGNAGTITSASPYQPNTTYTIYTELIGATTKRDYSDNDLVMATSITTPADVTTTAIPNTADWTIKNLVLAINSRSRVCRNTYGYGNGNKDVLAIAIGPSSATGTTIGTLLTNGTFTAQTVNGVASTITADLGMTRLFSSLITANTLLSTDKIINVNAGSLTSDTGATKILVIGLPRLKAAYYDNINGVQTSVRLNVGGGFQSVLGTTSIVTTTIPCDEGTGQGWKYKNESESRSQLQVHTMQTDPYKSFFSKGVNYISETTNYDSYIIDHYDSEENINSTSYAPARTIILAPVTVTPNESVTTINNNSGLPTITRSTTFLNSMESVLGTWLKASTQFSSYTAKNLTTPTAAVGTGTISGTTFTDATHSSGSFAVGMALTGTGVFPGTIITALVSGTGANSGGTYTVNIAQTVASTTITGNGPLYFA